MFFEIQTLCPVLYMDEAGTWIVKGLTPLLSQHLSGPDGGGAFDQRQGNVFPGPGALRLCTVRYEPGDAKTEMRKEEMARENKGQGKISPEITGEYHFCWRTEHRNAIGPEDVDDLAGSLVSCLTTGPVAIDGQRGLIHGLVFPKVTEFFAKDTSHSPGVWDPLLGPGKPVTGTSFTPPPGAHVWNHRVTSSSLEDPIRKINAGFSKHVVQEETDSL
ncbi:hypothetical protein E5288_WYG006196 [Bos mutus]|uniref:Uncharacterized protein n=1 Tax=Bos mutus TaxID=72004 RepID=A0A6B0QU37_9CETA|nr:hypothetical protein [Bos mutus]